MDYGTIIGRAWTITRRYTWLWIPGLLVVGLGSGNVDLALPGGFDIAGLREAITFDVQAVSGIVATIGVLTLFGLALWVLGVIGRGALVAAVDGITREDEVSLITALEGGLRYFGRLFWIGLPAAVPALLLVFLSFILMLPGVSDDTLAGVVTLCLLPLCCLLVAASLSLTLIQHFADRAAIIEDLEPAAAYQRGWAVLRQNRSRITGLALTWAALTLLARLLLLLPAGGVILPVLFLSVSGVSVSAGPLAVVCLAVFLSVLAFLLHALLSVFTSAMWTLAYRDCTGLPVSLHDVEIDDTAADAADNDHEETNR